jgi:hypothetical protein
MRLLCNVAVIPLPSLLPKSRRSPALSHQPSTNHYQLICQRTVVILPEVGKSRASNTRFTSRWLRLRAAWRRQVRLHPILTQHLTSMDARLSKIAQQLQCWVRDATNHLSPLGTKEIFCRPWRDFTNGVRLYPAVN